MFDCSFVDAKMEKLMLRIFQSSKDKELLLTKPYTKFKLPVLLRVFSVFRSKKC